MKNQLRIIDTPIGKRVCGERVKNKIDAVIEWAGDNPSFEDDFVRSLKDQFDEWENLSIPQWDALTRIVDQFRMDLENYGYGDE